LALCDGRRTDFPLGMRVETVIELRRAPRAGDKLVVLRVSAREPASVSAQCLSGQLDARSQAMRICGCDEFV
jgi:hypothetical protein